ERIAIHNTQHDFDVDIESYYPNPSDVLPARVLQKSRLGKVVKQTEIKIDNIKILTKKDDFNWGLEMVELRPHVFVTAQRIEKNKPPVNAVFFYDGKVIREATKKDFDLYGLKTEPAEIITKDNSRRSNPYSWWYAFPLIFFGTAIVLLVRKWRAGSNK
ncbi:MAG: hypothetical protein ACRCZF_05265, partial [Gemmataceae bacterium]